MISMHTSTKSVYALVQELMLSKFIIAMVMKVLGTVAMEARRLATKSLIQINVLRNSESDVEAELTDFNFGSEVWADPVHGVNGGVVMVADFISRYMKAGMGL